MSGAVVPSIASVKMGREVGRLAERGGFEPPVEVYPLQQISKAGGAPPDPSPSYLTCCDDETDF